MELWEWWKKFNTDHGFLVTIGGFIMWILTKLPDILDKWLTVLDKWGIIKIKKNKDERIIKLDQCYKCIFSQF